MRRVVRIRDELSVWLHAKKQYDGWNICLENDMSKGREGQTGRKEGVLKQWVKVIKDITAVKCAVGMTD